MRVSELRNHVVYDLDGNQIGYIGDVLVGGPPDDVPAITHVLLLQRKLIRLFGYERDDINGPWLIEKLAGWLQGARRVVSVSEVRLDPGPGPSWAQQPPGS